MKKITVLVLFILSACSYAAEPPEQAVRTNDQGVAIDGYSPVSYFTEGRAEKGSKEFAVKHDGAFYWMKDMQQLEAFVLEPERYVPAHGGWCTLMMGGSGRRTPGHPESFALVDDRLMLFWSGDTEETKGMGLANWASKTKGNERREVRYVEDADKKWTRFVEGKRGAKIFLYKESDMEGITAAQLADATIAFQQ